MGRYTAHRGVPCKFWIFPLSWTFTRDRPAYLCLGWRRVTMAGAVSTVAGNGEAGVADGLRGSRGSCPPPGPRGTHWWPALACSAARRSARGVLWRDNRVCIRRGGHRCRALRGRVAAGEVRARTRPERARNARTRAGRWRACVRLALPGTHSGPVLCRQGAALADGRRCARNPPHVSRGLCATEPAAFPALMRFFPSAPL